MLMVAVMLAAGWLTGCDEPGTPLTPLGNAFTYETANDFSPDGLGVWRAQLTDAGMLSLRYSVRDYIEPFSPQPLPPAVRAELWRSILACDFPQRLSSTRAGQPDEQLLIFTLFYSGKNHYCKIWATEAGQDPALRALLDLLTELIKARSTRPVQLY